MSTSPEDVEDISEKVAERVVSRLLLVLGINASDPKELIEFQKDFVHLRQWRTSWDLAKRRGLATTLAFMITAILGYILLLFKH